MALDRLIKIDGGGISTTSDYRVGVITASKFIGPFDGTAGNFSGIITASGANFSGNVTIGGTLTYEDVTNIDSVGIITGKGADINGDLDVDGHTNLDNVSVAGVTTFSDNLRIIDGKKIQLGTSQDLEIYHSSNNSVVKNKTGNLTFMTTDSGEFAARFIQHGAVELYHDHVKRFETSSVGVSIPQDLDVDGHTNLDNVSIAGVTTHNEDVWFKGATSGRDVYWDKSANELRFNDNANIFVGNNKDAFFSHDGSSTRLQDQYGHFFIGGNLIQIKSGNLSEEYARMDNTSKEVKLFHNSIEKFTTKSTGIVVHGTTTTTGLGVTSLAVAGVSTFSGDIDVDGHTNLDNVSVAGVTTFAGAITAPDVITAGALLHEGDTNTLVHFSAEDTIELKTHGFSRLSVTNNGVALTGGYLNANGNRIILGDSSGANDDRLVLGNNNDLQLFHDASDSYIQNQTGVFFIQNTGDLRIRVDNTDAAIHCVRNGAVELYHNNIKRLETSSVGVSIPQDLDVDGHTNLDNASVSGITTFSKSGSALRLNDGSILRLGNADADFFLYHDGNNIDYISAGASKQLRLTTDDFIIKGANNTETLMTAAKDGAVSLYHNNTKRLETFDNNPFVGVSVTNDLILNGSGDTAIRWAVGGNAVGNFKWGMYHANADGHLRLFDNVNSRTVTVWKNTGAIELNYGTNKKLETTSAGVTVQQELTISGAEPRLTFVDTDNNPDFQIWANAQRFSIYDSTNSATRLRITSSGNIGIGQDNPDQKLHVYEQSGSSQAYIHVQNNRARNAAIKFTTTQGSWLVGQGIGVDADRFSIYDTQERFIINSSGDVGIGQLAPAGKLHISSGTSGDCKLIIEADTDNNAEGDNPQIEFRQDGGVAVSAIGHGLLSAQQNGLVLANGVANGYISFATGTTDGHVNATERFRITPKGDVCVNNMAYNTYETAGTNINTMVDNNEKRSGVYWINYGGEIFRAYIKANWCEDRNWILAAKFFDMQDMPSGSSLWTNDTWVNESDFNLYGGIFSKYPAWRYFPFDRLAMQMGNRIPPIMRFSGNQTLYGAFSGGRASNGGGVTASSTYPAMSGTSVTYHSMSNFMGPDFYDVGGSEDRIQSYGLNKWANNAAQTTSAQNRGSEHVHAGSRQDGGSLQYASLKGWGLTVEDSHPIINGIDSIGVAGAWIGCPLDEGNSQQGSNSSNVGADSGFGFGFCAGNPGRTGTAGYAEWARGTECVNTLPAYIWLSAD